MAAAAHSSSAPQATHLVLAGNPNSGKTTLFNSLTGLRAKVGNYPGVTVERKEGRLLGSPKDRPAMVLDLPGTYSLSPQSLDEQVARDVLLNRLKELPAPARVVLVLDASNLQRNLYFATQVIELGYPTAVALNMIDVARDNGHEIDASLLAKLLGVPVLPIVASTGEGVPTLRQLLLADLPPAGSSTATPLQFCPIPKAMDEEVTELTRLLQEILPNAPFSLRAEALLALSDEKFIRLNGADYPDIFGKTIAAARSRLEKEGIDWRSAPIEARYQSIAQVDQAVSHQAFSSQETLSDRLDRIFTHKIWGLLIFVLLMTLMFQTIFTFAELPMKGLEEGVNWIGRQVGTWLQPGDLHDLLVNGVVKGVGAVVVFLPQICLLFFFIGLLEDTGYMARAAFLMDRLMSRVGLHGKSFIPMLSSFACAIPGIMATRTIESPKDRLITILVAPLMSCSARLPVYTLLIGACIPNQRVLGFLHLPGLTLLAMYLLGIVVALLMAWIFKKTLLKGPAPMLIMELPPYKRPLARIVARHMWDRSKLFLRRAGTVILGINILLWFLATYPKSETAGKLQALRRDAADPAALASLEKEAAGENLRHSFAGKLGHAIEPLIRPLGFDWKIGIGIVSSFAAREVFVSTMSLVYNVGEFQDSTQATQTLAQTLKEQRREDGTPVYRTRVAVALMVFYVFALQCVSTIAIVRRETNGWRWPIFQWIYMGALAWVLAFVTYQGARILGIG